MSDKTKAIPHAAEVQTKRVKIAHPTTGEETTIYIPADHNGSRVKVEFPDGETAYTEGWDPADRAISAERPTVPCPTCGQLQVLTSTELICSACGAKTAVVLKVAQESAEGQDQVEPSEEG